jgi:hypothetical protein
VGHSGSQKFVKKEGKKRKKEGESGLAKIIKPYKSIIFNEIQCL